MMFHDSADEDLEVIRQRLVVLSRESPALLIASWLRAQLRAAARAGDFALVECLLRTEREELGGVASRGGESRSIVLDGPSLVAAAAFGGNPHILRAFVDRAAAADSSRSSILIEIAKRDSTTGECPIHIAAACGNRAMVRALLYYGTEVNIPVEGGRIAEREGLTALHWAAARGHCWIVEDLIMSGADIDARVSHSGECALHLASRRGQDAVVGVLLDMGASATVLSLSGLTAMDTAACHNHPDTVREFLHRGVDPNSRNPKGYTALHQAAYHNASEVMEVLIEAGGSLHVTTDSGFTPLHVAAFSLHRCFAKGCVCVTSASPDANRWGDDDKKTEEDTRCSCAVRTIARTVARYGGHRDSHGEQVSHSKQVLQVDAVDKAGSTPLQIACAYLREQAVSDLLSMGADEKIVDPSAAGSSFDSKTHGRKGVNAANGQHHANSVARVRAMLAAAPAERAWRRRGWLVTLRARMRCTQASTVDRQRSEQSSRADELSDASRMDMCTIKVEDDTCFRQDRYDGGQECRRVRQKFARTSKDGGDCDHGAGGRRNHGARCHGGREAAVDRTFRQVVLRTLELTNDEIFTRIALFV